MFKFCENEGFPYVKCVYVNFITGKMKFDINSSLQRVGDLKKEIFEEKGISPSLQTLWFQKKSFKMIQQ